MSYSDNKSFANQKVNELSLLEFICIEETDMTMSEVRYILLDTVNDIIETCAQIAEEAYALDFKGNPLIEGVNIVEKIRGLKGEDI